MGRIRTGERVPRSSTNSSHATERHLHRHHRRPGNRHPTKIDELRVLLEAFTVSLTDEERASYFKLGDARLAFDVKCSDYIHQRPDLVPASVNVTEYDKDGAAWGAVNRIHASSTPSTGRSPTPSWSSAPIASTRPGFLQLPRLRRPHRPARRRRNPQRPQTDLPRPPQRPHPHAPVDPGLPLVRAPRSVIHGAWSIVDDRKRTAGRAPGTSEAAENTPDDPQTTINDPKGIIDERIFVVNDALRTIIDPISIIDYKNRFINCAKGIVDDAIWIIGGALGINEGGVKASAPACGIIYPRIAFSH
ncbi:MAG TPA: hypothetical protein VGO11_02945 [Chthoniobacteraceae bacterium]|nr:hypothetical protein [Chthoniobacteraceae bacterium]